MNRFMLGRPFRKIVRDKKNYITVMVQLILAFAVLSIFLSLLIDIGENKKRMAEADVKYQISIQDYSFDYSKFDLITWGDAPVELNEYEKFPFSTEVLEEINGMNDSYKLGVNVKIEILYLGENLDEGEQLYVCYSSDVTTVGCSERMEALLAEANDQNTINAKDFPHQIQGDKLITVEGREYEREYTDDGELTIYIPIEVYYNLHHPKNLRETVLWIKADSQELVTSDGLNTILSQLWEWYGENYGFEIESELAHYMQQVEEAEKEAKVFIFISGIIFLIVLIGMMGIFIMIVNRRKREIAICCALGQTKKQVIFEMFVEIGVLNLSSYLIGVLISCLIMKNGISVATIVFNYHCRTGVILFALVVIFTGISVIPVRYLVKRMSPTDILSSL